MRAEPPGSSPTIAVVLPFRNAALWLPRCLAALAQEWAVPFELVAVDDGSSDASAALLQRLCRHWPSWRWRLLRTEGVGVSAARNLGLAATQAPFVAFLDADDRPMPGRLAQPLAVFHRQPELAHVHGAWWRIAADGRPLQLVQPWLEGAGFTLRDALNHKAVLPSAWTLRRSALEAVGGFDPQLSQAEDVDLLLRLARAGFQGAWLDQPLVRYRVHAEAASQRHGAQVEGLLQVVERHGAALPAAEAAELYYATLSWTVWLAWSRGDGELAERLLADCGRRCPWPPVRRPVHLLEVFARSAARVGQPFEARSLLASPFWGRAMELLQPA